MKLAYAHCPIFPSLRFPPNLALEVQAYDINDLRREVRGNSRGVISLALIRPVNPGGLTAQEAEERLTTLYEKDCLRNPQVSVFISTSTGDRSANASKPFPVLYDQYVAGTACVPFPSTSTVLRPPSATRPL